MKKLLFILVLLCLSSNAFAHNKGVLFTRDPQAAARGEGIYSPTGTWGDPTLATREKGKIATEATVAEILKQIETLRQAAPPNAGAAK